MPLSQTGMRPSFSWSRTSSSRYVTAEYLEDCGFSVLQAANADEAVGLLQANRDVGAVFSDIQMPGSMNGLGLAHWITETLPDVKVLLTSVRSCPPRHGNGFCLPSPTTWRRSSAGCAR